MTEEWAIEATGLTKSYGAVAVLRGIDLAVRPGTVFSLLGPNGAGKTTMVRILATLVQTDSGRARVAGFDVVSHQHHVRRRISPIITASRDAIIGRQMTRMTSTAVMRRRRWIWTRSWTRRPTATTS